VRCKDHAGDIEWRELASTTDGDIVVGYRRADKVYRGFLLSKGQEDKEER
jgi:hypothetical protein